MTTLTIAEEWRDMLRNGASRAALLDYVIDSYGELVDAVDELEAKVNRLEDQVYWLRQDSGEDA